jgi:dUTP pyrophosphatase
MRIKLLDPDLYAGELMEPARDGDAGIDLRAANETHVPHGRTVVIPLGVAVELEAHQVGWLTGRSSTALTWDLLTHEGKIDSGYRGEIHCVCTALTRSITIPRGDRICQLVVLQIGSPWTWKIVDELTSSNRGLAGLGSTGRA